MKSFILSLSLIASFSLFAQDAAKEGMMKNHPCAEDAKKFCSGVEKGHGAIMKCLKEHEKEVSPACTTAMTEGKEKMKAKVKDIITNCKDDAKKLCADAPRGHGGKIKCLEEKKDQVSVNCKAALP